MPSQGQQQSAPPTIGRWRRLYRLMLRAGKIASAISAVGAFILLVTPQIRVLPSVVIDPQNTFGTQFAIVNQGRVPVFDLRFICHIDAKASQIGLVINDASFSGPPIKALWPNQTATRNCPVNMAASETSIDAIIGYRWPFYFLSTAVPFYFTARKGSAGYFLVPDVKN